MRAITIAVFILILSISTSVVNEINNQPRVPQVQANVNVSESEIQEIATYNSSWWSGLVDSIKLTMKSIGTFFRVVKGALLLGSTIEALSPYPLPSSLVAGLNTLSLVAVALAVIQFVRGYITRAGD